jgi:vacuolar protein sorting-associated protein 13A/C
MEFVTSAAADSPDEDLLTVDYKRVQKMSPEFWTLCEGIDQSVDIRVSTFVFHAAPEPVVGLYDFVMSTFVPQSPEPASRDRPSDAMSLADTQAPTPTPAADKIRVVIRLASVKGE